jgi:chromosome segregation ATPase
MLRQIILRLLSWLEQSLDPDLQARVQELRNKVALQELERARFLEQLRASEQELIKLSRDLSENQRKRIELENAISHEKAELEKRIADRARLSDADKVELPL